MCVSSAFHLVVEASQRLACTNASDNYLVVPYSSPKVSTRISSRSAEVLCTSVKHALELILLFCQGMGKAVILYHSIVV